MKPRLSYTIWFTQRTGRNPRIVEQKTPGIFPEFFVYLISLLGPVRDPNILDLRCMPQGFIHLRQLPTCGEGPGLLHIASGCSLYGPLSFCGTCIPDAIHIVMFRKSLCQFVAWTGDDI